MTTRRRLVGTLLVVAMVGAAGIRAQGPVLRTTTYGVRIDALVSDGSRPVTNLGADDFEVRDLGVPQRIDAAAAVDHVAVAVVLDPTLEVRAPTDYVPYTTAQRPYQRRSAEIFPGILGACETLVRALRPNDRAAIVVAADRVIPLVSLTNDADALRQGLMRARVVPPRALPIATDGRGTVTFAHPNDGLVPQSSIWDAAFVAASLVTHDNGRPLVVVVSDGIDSSSWLTKETVARTLANVGIAVDFVRSSSRRTHAGVAAPEDLPKITGGQVFQTTDGHLEEKLAARLDQLRQSYILTYEPRGVGTNDGWHTLDVKVKGRKATVKTRPGYFANRPPR